MRGARLVVTAVAAVALALPAVAGAATCPPKLRWVTAWSGVPSDAAQGTPVSDLFSASGGPKSTVNDSTVRALITPTLGGSRVRVRLSNRFGAAPVTFARTTIAKRAEGAAVARAAVTFAGAPSVTVAAGEDFVSDEVAFSYEAFDDVAVSTDLGHDAGARPFVTGLDVRARAGTVVGFGDSLTDGHQGESPGIPETKEGIDANGRWPDVLARRLRAAGVPLAVANAGISGNRILRDGAEGGNGYTYGPAALRRLDADAISQAGVTTVILFEGINDLGQDPGDDPPEVIAGYTEIIGRLHAAGLRVVQGTLTPARGADGGHGSAETEAKRQEINDWIRTRSPADAVVDFDAAVRDPSDPSRIDPQYDGSDHLHFNPAGHRRLGEVVDIAQLRLPPGAEPKRVHVRVRLRRVR